MKKVKIALLGLGNVGRGVWMILNSNKEEIMKRCGYEVEVAKVLIRDKNKPRGVEIPNELITTDFNDILNDDSIKIVIEVMGGIEPAREYMIKCMDKKKHIVTANKMLLATGGDELFVLGLSFIGWWILIAITFGIAGLWVYPYYEVTCANFYLALKIKKI